MPYELDSTRHGSSDSTPSGTEETSSDEHSVGIPIPDEHVGAFVAEAFEDPERNTTWQEVVDAMVAADARDAWEQLSPVEQAQAVLDAAADYDRKTIEHLETVDDRTATSEVEIEEALRCRRNADRFRDGIADAYAEGYLDDTALLAAIDQAEFETRTIAAREDELERVDSIHDIDFRPYGGTLFDDEEGPDPGANCEATETW